MPVLIDDQVRYWARKKKLCKLTLYTETGEGSCPLNCTYCYLDKGSKNQVMPEQTLHDAIDWLKLVSPAPKGIHFFGTEPLKNFELIKSASLYSPELHIGVTINGYLLSSDMIQWMSQNKVYVYVYSIDGSKEHNIQRITRNGKPSWDKVADNFSRLAQSEAGRSVTARGTWYPTDYDLVSRFRALEALGAKSITFIPCTDANFDQEETARAYKDLADYYQGGKPPSRLIEKTLKLIASGKDNSKHNGCGIGKGAWCVSPDGRLSLCQSIVEDDNGTIGNIYTGVTNPKAFNISRQLDLFHSDEYMEKHPKCKACIALKICQGIGFCGVLNKLYTGSYDVPSEGYCNHLRGLYKAALYWLSLRQKDKITKTLMSLKMPGRR